MTEVYHITGEAEDAGVVYSEMQAVENTVVSLTYREMLRDIYPEPSGYRYETGGIMKNLRESIDNTKVRILVLLIRMYLKFLFYNLY